MNCISALLFFIVFDAKFWDLFLLLRFSFKCKCSWLCILLEFKKSFQFFKFIFRISWNLEFGLTFQIGLFCIKCKWSNDFILGIIFQLWDKFTLFDGILEFNEFLLLDNLFLYMLNLSLFKLIIFYIITINHNL